MLARAWQTAMGALILLPPPVRIIMAVVLTVFLVLIFSVSAAVDARKHH